MHSSLSASFGSYRGRNLCIAKQRVSSPFTSMHLVLPFFALSCLHNAGNVAAGGARQIRIVHGNALDADVDDATAAFVYLVPAGMKSLKEALVSMLQRGARVVTYGACCAISSR